MNPAIAEQLRNRGIDAISAQEVHQRAIGDPEQLRFATNAGRIICTEDSDYTELASTEMPHAGIAYFPNAYPGIGYAVKALEVLSIEETAENMQNSLRFM